ncbi:DUF5682 family protein [Nannocystis pusilla]|uniref:DUF5682 family protein n=1 Tax=Nannocystis pusilla TaxID=889268 RepID=A0A9X3F7H1_9BACT|nr:DUF5682 family protein [Nannocystis pusilla]MCY1013128.1 DUF5682 family protein [Nannocystis pusilla]
MEGCEDLNASLAGLHHCRFPVALQAFAPEAPAFPADWTPLNVVLPLTEFSAEYQAIAYCLQNPGTKLVFVDRSVDHVFQWMPKGGPPPGEDSGEADDGGEEPATEETAGEGEGASTGNTGNLHGGAVGLQIGDMQPTFGDFLDVLLRNAKVRHYSEWWTQYVEGPTLACDYGTYRQVFFLIGSLLRRIGITEKDRAADCERERYMWTRIREHMKAHKIDPREAMYVCGAIHAVSPIPDSGRRARRGRCRRRRRRSGSTGWCPRATRRSSASSRCRPARSRSRSRCGTRGCKRSSSSHLELRPRRRRRPRASRRCARRRLRLRALQRRQSKCR